MILNVVNSSITSAGLSAAFYMTDEMEGSTENPNRAFYGGPW